MECCISWLPVIPVRWLKMKISLKVSIRAISMNVINLSIEHKAVEAFLCKNWSVQGFHNLWIQRDTALVSSHTADRKVVRLSILPPGNAYVPDGHVKNLQRLCEENFV
ncbi:hypothetical protein KIN20_014096 [Parelaphostrongylus tenuis]|uniref:Uncharacterized protein n=1 Tax=Parelaphostrongylus tenuis TaxID=148309 RepID=A0AAD5MEH3_PARTN|nr:hypothetical protein KIN20_014096 [Parelaphostrongylus tenuis]